MANLKEIRNRIASVSSTMQITSAMKMVSAAKLKKATDAISQMRPYSDKLTELIQNLSSSFESGDNNNPYIRLRPINKILLVAITSNRGLLMDLEPIRGLLVVLFVFLENILEMRD